MFFLKIFGWFRIGEKTTDGQRYQDPRSSYGEPDPNNFGQIMIDGNNGKTLRILLMIDGKFGWFPLILFFRNFAGGFLSMRRLLMDNEIKIVGAVIEIQIQAKNDTRALMEK